MNVAALNASHAGQITAPTRRTAAATEDAGAADRKKVSRQFEAILVRQLLGKTMSSMLGSDESTAGSVYGDMLTDSMATQLSAGRGLGLGAMLERQLAPRTPSASASGALKSSPP
ncbi:MAG: rod-binding protein [Undibacterium sp.]|nr:rod-binding protein [Opitutaceae bacterium]